MLEGTFALRILQPWHENIAKRQVKAPKLYFRDTGILHSLLGIRSRAELDVHPKVGASWEGFALECVLRELGLRGDECFFWATHADAGLDLLVRIGGKRIGIEAKRTDVPRVTRSMRSALADLRLHRLFVIVPGRADHPLDDRIDVLGIEHRGALAARARLG